MAKRETLRVGAADRRDARLTYGRERRTMIKAARAVEDRRAALRFLRRAVRSAASEYRKIGGASMSNRHHAALWRVVVAASHKSGTFER